MSPRPSQPPGAIRVRRRFFTLSAFALATTAFLASASLTLLLPADGGLPAAPAPGATQPHASIHEALPEPAAPAAPGSSPSSLAEPPARSSAAHDSDLLSRSLDALDDPSTPPVRRGDALRALAQGAPEHSAHRVLRVLEEGPGGAVEAEALRQIAPLAKQGVVTVHEAQRLVLASLERSRDPELALAAGGAIDALEPSDSQLFDAMARAALPAARVVLVRALAARGLTGTVGEIASNDPSPLVRAEALTLFLRADPERGTDAVFSALEAEDRGLRRHALRLVAGLPRTPHTTRRLLQALVLTKAPALATALTRAHLARDTKPADQLVALTLGSGPNAAPVTVALGVAPTPERTAVLRKILEHSLSEDARSAALQALTRAGSLTPADLQAIGSTNTSARVRADARALITDQGRDS